MVVYPVKQRPLGVLSTFDLVVMLAAARSPTLDTVAETDHGVDIGRIAWFALGEIDPARREERAHAVVAQLPVDVLVVVPYEVERLERRSAWVGPVAEECVEHLLPRRGMQARRPREDPVEVEETRANPVR